jgi:hypothetical protein
MTPDTLTAALAYAARGWRVLPIMPGQKRPPMAAWQHAATTDPTTIESWWTQLYRDHGLGVATGPESGIFIVDVDVANGKRGDESLQELVDTYGPLPETATVITPSGGTHLYFRYPQGQSVKNSASNRLGQWIDIRGDGGQCLAPPTVASTGVAYEWEGGEAGEIAEAPGWLLALLTEPERAPVDSSIRESAPSQGDDGPARRFNDSTTWGELLTRDGWTLTATLPDGEERWTRPGKESRDGMSATVGHEGRDVLKVFTSSVPGLEADRAYSRFGYEAAIRHGGDRSALASHLIVSGIVPLRPFAQTEPMPLADQFAEHFNTEHREELAHLVDWSKFWTSDKGDEEWIAYPIIPAKRSVALYAPAKAGKSTIVLAIVAAVATGRRILGGEVGQKRDVLYLDYEMTEDDLHERLSELGYDESEDMGRLHYALLPSLPPLDTIEGAKAIIELVKRTGSELVVVDTFGRAVEGDEDKADTVRAFYRHTGLALKAMDVAVLRTDHSGKDVAKGQRGSSAKNDDVDVVWQLSRKEDAQTLKRTHSRISWVPAEIAIKRRETECGFDYVIDRGLVRFKDGTGDNAATLDRLGVPLKSSQRNALVILKAAGNGMHVSKVKDALRFRLDAVTSEAEMRADAGLSASGCTANPKDAPPKMHSKDAPAISKDALDAPALSREYAPDALAPGKDALAARIWDASPPLQGDAPQPHYLDFLNIEVPDDLDLSAMYEII